jgi:hypothetical protein
MGKTSQNGLEENGSHIQANRPHQSQPVALGDLSFAKIRDAAFQQST